MNNAPEFPDSTNKPLRPLVLVSLGAAWLVFLALLIWLHARESTQPPIYDALNYYFKAKFVWANLLSGHIVNWLNIDPSFRPPGTVLMSYPFGFDPDFRGFYFRSVFFPIALVFVSVFIAAWRSDGSRRYLRLVALTAAFLPTVSLFYYFEPHAGRPPALGNWGMVDGFLTGLAALAAACAVRSIASKSLVWGIASTLVGVLMIFVKPSGALLAAITGAILALGWIWNLKQGWAVDRRRALLKRFVALILVQAGLLGGAVLLATRSLYLGTDSITYGNAAIDIMRAELKAEPSILLSVMHSGLGPFIPIWAVAMTLLWVHGRFRQRDLTAGGRPLDDLLVAAAAIALLLGAWFWLVGSGGQTIIRYFTPFFYVAILCALGPALGRLTGSARSARLLVSLLMGIAVANTVLLLALPNPSLAWQAASGVNVVSGTKPASISQAQSVIANAPAGSKTVVVYSMVQGIADAMFESTFDLHVLQARKPVFLVRRPIDWQRRSTFRVDEIVTSDYILFDPGRALEVIPTTNVDFVREQAMFHRWVTGLTAADGVEVASAEADSTLLRIVDPARLRQSLETMMRSNSIPATPQL